MVGSNFSIGQEGKMSRKVLLVSSPQYLDKAELVLSACKHLSQNSINVLLEQEHLESLANLGVAIPSDVESYDGSEVELAVVLGGDGSILRAAELLRGTKAPILGINAGHFGFMAEAESGSLISALDVVISKRYQVRDRLAIEVVVTSQGKETYRSWALNEVALEKSARERMLEVVIEVDSRPVSSFGCDGVVVSTPTGSTAYAFSAGGPVIWPNVEALMMIPLSAHALFARPLVVGPHTHLAIEVLRRSSGAGVLWCDGRRTFELPPGSRVEVRQSSESVPMVVLQDEPFADRIVKKFSLPVTGWRGPDSDK
jgi:NAD+ kinase